MKIGVLDTDGDFKHRFFRDKKLDIRRKSTNGEYRKYGIGFTHGEIVCSMILKENPQAEIILYPIISENMKCSVLELIRGIESLIESGVDIINLSVGDEYNYHPELESICKDAQRQGILIVAAHSNRNVYATYPADLSFVVGVKCTDKNSPEKIMLFDESRNEVIFSSSYFSLYHLEIPRLIQGNSFACAKISGLLSWHKVCFRDSLKNLEHSFLNHYYPCETLKQKQCLFCTNRPNDQMEQRFINEVTNTIANFTIEDMDSEMVRQLHDWEILFIDCDSYQAVLPYKDKIRDFKILHQEKEIVLRYPLFSLEERMNLDLQYRVLIHQFFI